MNAEETFELWQKADNLPDYLQEQLDELRTLSGRPMLLVKILILVLQG